MFKIFILALLWIPFLILLLLLCLPLSLFFCYKLFVCHILRRVLQRHDLIEPVKNLDFGFASDNFWSKPLGGIAFVHVVEGQICTESVFEKLNDVLFKNKQGLTISDNMCNDYLRLTSLYPDYFGGYPFWRTIKPGKLELTKHVRIVGSSKKQLTETNLDAILNEWLQSGFCLHQPLWDVLLIPDYETSEGTKSVFGFRIHHVVGDGYSMLNFLQRIFDLPNSTPSIPSAVAVSKTTSNFKTFLSMPHLIWTHASHFFLHTDAFDFVKSSHQYSLARTTVNLEKIKEIRRSVQVAIGDQVPLGTLILFLLGKALRRAFSNGSLKLRPGRRALQLKNVKVAMSLGKLSVHPGSGFSNHWDHGIFTIEVESENDVTRLKSMSEEFSTWRKSRGVDMNGMLMQLYSTFPRCLYSKLMMSVRGTTIGMTNLPGPTHRVKFLGENILEKYAFLGLQFPNTSFTIGCFSYNNKLSLTLTSNEEALDCETSTKILSFFQQEMDNLQVHGIQDEYFHV